jgi:hypothetical protein
MRKNGLKGLSKKKEEKVLIIRNSEKWDKIKSQESVPIRSARKFTPKQLENQRRFADKHRKTGFFEPSKERVSKPKSNRKEGEKRKQKKPILPPNIDLDISGFEDFNNELPSKSKLIPLTKKERLEESDKDKTLRLLFDIIQSKDFEKPEDFLLRQATKVNPIFSKQELKALQDSRELTFEEIKKFEREERKKTRSRLRKGREQGITMKIFNKLNDLADDIAITTARGVISATKIVGGALLSGSKFIIRKSASGLFSLSKTITKMTVQELKLEIGNLTNLFINGFDTERDEDEAVKLLSKMNRELKRRGSKAEVGDFLTEEEVAFAMNIID